MRPALNNAFVLRCDARSHAAVARLRQTLASALQRSGLHPQPSGTPHMTMHYDQRVIAELPIEPICCTATRFALIISHHGLGHHKWLGHWQLAVRPLRPPLMTAAVSSPDACAASSATTAHFIDAAVAAAAQISLCGHTAPKV